MDAKTVEARADAAGHWRALLPAMHAGGPLYYCFRFSGCVAAVTAVSVVRSDRTDSN